VHRPAAKRFSLLVKYLLNKSQLPFWNVHSPSGPRFLQWGAFYRQNPPGTSCHSPWTHVLQASSRCDLPGCGILVYWSSLVFFSGLSPFPRSAMFPGPNVLSLPTCFSLLCGLAFLFGQLRSLGLRSQPGDFTLPPLGTFVRSSRTSSFPPPPPVTSPTVGMIDTPLVIPLLSHFRPTANPPTKARFCGYMSSGLRDFSSSSCCFSLPPSYFPSR